MMMIYEAKGDYESALESYLKQRQFSGNTDENHPGWLMTKAQIQALGGRTGEARESLEKAMSSELIKNSPRGYAYEFLIAYALLDDRENAMKWLGTAKGTREQMFNFVKFDPRLDKLRQETRFKEITGSAF